MKRSLLLFVCIFCSGSPLFAAISLDPLLNKITLQLKAEQWVTTQTALVNVNVNAAISDQNIANLQSSVLQKLKGLADGDWHIVSFVRQQDQSGLESIQIAAQARLAQTNLGDLRNKAKSLSKPGETYTIANVDFVPSDDEYRNANSSLRNNIYQQIKTEIDAINKIYPEQKFYLHTVDFLSNVPMPMAQNYAMKTLAAGAAIGGAEQVAPPLNVGNKVELRATVEIAAMPDYVVQKLMATTPTSNVQKAQ